MNPTAGRAASCSPLRHRLLAAALAVAGLATVATVAGSPADASAPHEGTRSQIPWSEVGPGWRLATWARTTKSRTTLYVVAPDGHRWSVAHLNPYVEPTLWSPDHRRVIVSGEKGVAEIDLHTGRSHAVRLPANSDVLSYSRPRGQALLVQVQVKQGGDYTTRLERLDEYGHHQKTYPASVRGAGALSAADVVETADGSELVLGAAHGLVLLRNNGTVVRRLHAGTERCSVASRWTASSVLAECNGALRSVPLSGGQGRAISKGVDKQNPFGYSDAWNYSAGRLGLAPNGCGPESLVRFTKAGNGVRIAVPGYDKQAVKVSYVGHHGDVVDFLSRRELGCVSGATTLLAYNVVTHHSKALLGPGVNGGTVEGVAEYTAA